jgi:nicotinamide-nucleotide amidase
MTPELQDRAAALLEMCRAKGLKIATAESCTGGLVAALLTSVAGSSDVVDCGFVTYSNDAKQRMLGVSAEILAQFGAVSRECAIAMAEGALANSNVDLAVAVTGIAGPGGGTAAKPVGLVHFSCARKGLAAIHQVERFGDIGREAVRVASVAVALALLETQAL